MGEAPSTCTPSFNASVVIEADGPAVGQRLEPGPGCLGKGLKQRCGATLRVESHSLDDLRRLDGVADEGTMRDLFVAQGDQAPDEVSYLLVVSTFCQVA
jgi:hypothetical protein